MASSRRFSLLLPLLAACAAAPPAPAPPAPALTSVVPPRPEAAVPARTTITILHTNDVHSRIDPVPQAQPADPALGGLVRRKAMIDRVRAERGADHVLLFDAGDFTVGTVDFTVWKGSEEVQAMNAMGYDAVTPGNHELDLGTAGLARLLTGGPVTVGGKAVPTERLAAKVVVSNLDVSGDPALRDLVVPRAILTRGGERFGVVGAITDDVVDSLGTTARWLSYVASVQAQVDALGAAGVDKIVLVSHSGTALDTKSVAEITGVDVVVAGHDHALLGDPATLRAQGLADTTTRYKGTYPRVLKGKDGQPVLLVSANEWGRLLGRLDVTFDGAGHVMDGWSGAPIVLAQDGGEDAAFAAKVETYRAPARAMGETVVGRTTHALHKATTGQAELGALFADALLAATASRGAVAALAEGDARDDLPAGTITFADVVATWPFEMPVHLVELSGAELEAAVALGLSLEPPVQLAGVTARVARAAGERGKITVRELRVGGRKAAPTARYVVAVDEYVAGGGDGYAMIKAAIARQGGPRPSGTTVRDAVVAHLRAHAPAAPKVEGRVVEEATPAAK